MGTFLHKTTLMNTLYSKQEIRISKIIKKNIPIIFVDVLFKRIRILNHF